MYLKNVSRLRFSVVSRQKRRRSLVPITPMPHYSDMDTPELKNKLNRSVCSCFDPHAVDEEAYLITSHAVTLAAWSTLDKALSAPRRFGVRPLPKRQMIHKLKEIHQYTHQLVSSEDEDEAQPGSCATRMRPSSVAAGNRQHTCAQPLKFKEPTRPPPTSPRKHSWESQVELLSASQGSSTSSTAASEESER